MEIVSHYKSTEDLLKRTYILLLLIISVIPMLHAKNMRVYGYIVDSDNKGLEFVNAYTQIDGEIVGTASNKNGYYELVFPQRDTILLTYSMVGYTTVQQRLINPGDVICVRIEMATDAEWLNEVEVRGIQLQTGTMDQISATNTRIMPDATGGSIESLLITFAGVNQNNELSSQYNVRGGSFDENQVYVNGIEIHRPLLIRSGQQEGLSFVNPEMVENLQFSAGGYDAKFGDKMSSVLDIEYKRPTRFEGSINASLLGAGVYVGHGDSTYSQMHGLRYKTSKYMLGALSTSGNYNPTFVDYQTYITWKLNKHNPQRGWSMAFLGNVSLNSYDFVPDSLSESFGGTTNATNLAIWYHGQERDRFLTAFGALSAKGKVGKDVTIGFDLSGFYTNEQENYDIAGEYVLTQGDAASSANGVTTKQEAEYTDALGTGVYAQHARNVLTAGVATFAHHGQWKHSGNNLEWGVSAQGEWIRDQINEWEWRDSAGYSLPNHNDNMDLFYSMRGRSQMQSLRVQAYVQNTHKWNTQSGQWILTVGGRLQWWSFNNEWLPSPRASVTWLPGWKRDFAFRFATGLYYQAPFYKEVRDTTTNLDGVTRISLNKDLRAQRSVHAVLGGDYYFRAWGRPFKLTTEVYGKYTDRMESYSVDNVRVRYSGKNDARGYTVGLDLKLYGELVPGADSWISFSTMQSRMQLIDQPELGWLLAPQEQRYSFTMFFQDYLPQLPQLRFHVKFIWSEGLPFSSPRNFTSRRHMSDYRRIDLGATYVFDKKTARFMRAASAKHVAQWAIQFEVFNLVGWNNVNSYFWVSDAYGRQWASPNYLTGRRFNLKLSVDLK